MSDASPDPALFDKIVNLTKRRGFVFPSAEIYGGFRSTYDYGPVVRVPAGRRFWELRPSCQITKVKA